MSVVLGQHSSRSNNKRRVGFADSINWEEENRRSCRGSDSRRRRREERKMAFQQRDEKLQSCLDIVVGAQHEDSLVVLCGESPIIRVIVEQLISGGNANNNHELRQLLADFRSMRKETLKDLTQQERECVSALMGTTGFYEKYEAYIPRSVVSSAESTPE